MDDNQWTYSQWLNVLLLAAAPMTVLGAWSGELSASIVVNLFSVCCDTGTVVWDPVLTTVDFKLANREEKERRRELQVAALTGPSYIDISQAQDDVPLTSYPGSNLTSHPPSYSSRAALLNPNAPSQSRYSSQTTFNSFGSGVGSPSGYGQRPTSY